MFDKDTLVVSYDASRGEPRGSRPKAIEPASSGLGSCVDCTLCVQVCPTGIDIRTGLQYECIGCAACIDVCDQVMDKMSYPRGLIRYTTENALENKWGASEIWQQLLRPRVLIYTGIVWLVIAAVLLSLMARHEIKVDVVRDRNSLGRIVDDGLIENVYRLQIMNTTEMSLDIGLELEGLSNSQTAQFEPLHLLPTQSRWLPVRVQAQADLSAGSHTFYFVIKAYRSEMIHDDDDADAGPKLVDQIKEKAVFLMPRQ
jgi:cytochrome c oxidase accessory protein FixG